MSTQSITKGQLKRLQTLWGQYARHELLPNTREARLDWANDILSKAKSARTGGISSFSDLTAPEAAQLINILQDSLGIAETSPARSQRRYRSAVKNRTQAHAAGTEGRRNAGHQASTIASTEDLGMIDAQLSLMEWDRTRLDAFLRSPSSPLGKKRAADPQLRTLGDINRVLWALKRIGRTQVSQ